MNIGTYNKVEKFLAFFLGIIVCNNVAYALKVGRTYINVSFVYGIIIFMFFIVFRKRNIKKCVKEINYSFRIYIIIALLSIVLAVVTFIDDISLISSYFNGIIMLALNLILYMDVIFLKDYKKYILKGLIIGFILNMLLSLIQYVTYNNGNYFSLYYFFPQPGFQINSYYGANNFLQQVADTFNIYGYRAQGFFLETSYYMAFIASTSIILFVITKKSFWKILSIISMIFIIALTSSGNMIVILFTFIIYYIFMKIKSKNNICEDKKINIKTFTTFFLIAVLLISFGAINFSNIEEIIKTNNVFEKFVNNINTANIANEGNKGRATSMVKALELVLKYPLGVGYNMSPTLLSLEYEDGILEQNATFNRLITIELEQGPLGLLFYVIYIYQISGVLILKAREKYTLALGIGVLGAFICQIGNGIGFFPFVILVFALANIELNEMKEENENDKRIGKQKS